MLNDREEVIYVGKAKQLKNRVSSYFRGGHEPKTAAMVSKVTDFNVIVAASEFEALVLENSLIKRHQPHYNILLRDDKGYPFIRLDVKSEYPRFTVVGKIAEDGARYFGPFGGRGATKDILDTICKALKLPTCGRHFPRDIGKDRPCLNHHMGVCEGYCRKAMPEEYNRAIHAAVMILEGKTKQLLEDLTEQMMRASEELRFEAAAELRDRIRAIERLQTRQKVIASVFSDTDVVAFYRGGKCCFSVLHYTDGELAGKDFDLLDEPVEDDAGALSALVRQYYTQRGAYPRQIFLPMEIEDAPELERLFTEASGHKVRIEVPRRGDRVRLLEAAERNAREEVNRATTAQQRRLKTLEWLQKMLSLPEIPRRIEAFDVSNLQDLAVVAAMTVFVNGKPLKRDYKKFRIRDVEGQNDYAGMREAVRRRCRRAVDGDESFVELPDVFFIDGGAVHAAAAKAELEALGLAVPVFGMVKDDRHRTRALVTPEGEEIGIAGNPAVFALVGGVQEETHRFAIEYHRSLRNEILTSDLDKIPGVGEKRRNALLKHFGSVRAIREAAPDELEKVVPSNVARAIREYYHPTERN